MKNLAIKKKIERRKAKSVRAIKAYWLAKAKEAYYETQDMSSLYAIIEADDCSEFEDYCVGDESSEDFKQDLLEDCLKDWDNAECALRNALTRYAQAIPKGGVY